MKSEDPSTVKGLGPISPQNPKTLKEACAYSSSSSRGAAEHCRAFAAEKPPKPRTPRLPTDPEKTYLWLVGNGGIGGGTLGFLFRDPLRVPFRDL